MFSDDNDELAGAVIDGKAAYSYTERYNNEGWFARAQYDYDQRIFGSASYRYDASSRFSPENRWGSFWSVGAAWIMSKEKWFKPSWVDMLKVKASVGSQGNDNIAPTRMNSQPIPIFTAGSCAGLLPPSMALPLRMYCAATEQRI